MTDWLTDQIDCAERCTIPEGKQFVRVPTPRHKWNDILRCPNCGDCFLIRPISLIDGEEPKR
jgi:hypothetical protein